MSKRFQLNIALILLLVAVGWQKHLPPWLSGFMVCMALVLFVTFIVPIPGLRKFFDARKARILEYNEKYNQEKMQAQSEKNAQEKTQKQNKK